MRVKYCGPARDYSGYGEANRHDIAALASVGVELTTQIPRYSLEIADFGHLGDIAGLYEDKELGYKIKIIHTTPNVYRQFLEAGKYNIGRIFWETDRIPADFAVNAQLLDEIWTGSEYNKQAIRNAGVDKPIYIIPEAIDTDIDDYKPYITVNEKDYKFYSIFEWTERKNPTALIEAFWREFENDEGVSLTIKTYIDNFTPDKKQEIRSYLRKIKKKLLLNRYAPLYVYCNLMDRYQMYRFHKTFDCFVSTHRGEGWGIPQMESLLMRRPVITTNCGGIHEYLEDKKTAYLLPYKLIKLTENTRNKHWYTPDQNWADVDISDVRAAMRYVYTHKTEAMKTGVEGGKIVDNLFSLHAVGLKMLDRLKEIQKKLEPEL
jgi:glycosyltransferase involved in cell wall biosynthesis